MILDLLSVICMFCLQVEKAMYQMKCKLAAEDESMEERLDNLASWLEDRVSSLFRGIPGQKAHTGSGS